MLYDSSTVLPVPVVLPSIDSTARVLLVLPVRTSTGTIDSKLVLVSPLPTTSGGTTVLVYYSYGSNLVPYSEISGVDQSTGTGGCRTPNSTSTKQGLWLKMDPLRAGANECIIDTRCMYTYQYLVLDF